MGTEAVQPGGDHNPMGNIKLLIVEDDNLTRNQLAKVVVKEGFAVEAAEDGTVGLEIFQKSSPDIVITDLRMPGPIDGLELVHAIKRAALDTEIIVTTAYGETETAIALLREGVLDYLKKPIELDELLLALGRARERVERRKNLPYFPRLLLADDEEGTRERLARVLQQERWDVVQAGDGRRAVELFVENKVDVVLLDVKMPKMDGLEALHAMRQITDDFAAIILTGYGDEALAIKAMREGALNFLKKPIDLDQLIVAVDKAIQRIQIERALRYRTREVQLAEQIIARITASRQVVIDLGSARSTELRTFGRELLDILPLELAVIDAKHKVRYANEHFAKRVGYEPQVVEQKWLDALAGPRTRSLNAVDLAEQVRLMVTGEIGKVLRIPTGPQSYVALVSLSLVEGNRTEPAVVLALRGEASP